ncbi:MAG: Kae1-associated serine/threonine protein kinase [Candidatus Micrarchaeota archaeon]|nr:Kae1-associated serine/threonine protein kinase [Candidatus Micrarchaeota archaeon]
MEMISEGAEARIYAGMFLDIPAAIKERVSKAYRVRELDSSIISQRTRSEARIMALASSSGVPVPNLMFVGGSRIYMQLLKGETLNRVLDRVPSKRLAAVMADLGRYLALMHNVGISHGDYTPANALVTPNGVYVIDFGLASVGNSVEDRALDLLLMKRSVDSKAFSGFIRAYRSAGKGAKPVLERLAEIERRGRYQNRSLD